MRYFTTLILTVLLVSGCICSPGGDAGTAGESAGAGEAASATTLKSSGGIVEEMMGMAGAISSGLPYKCTYTYENVQTETWIKGNKFHSKTNVEGEVAHGVSDGVWMYSWMEGQATGTKFKMSDVEDLSQQSEASGQELDYSDLDDVADTAVNVDCSPANIPDSMFVPPGNVQFKDMEEMMKQMQQAQGGGGGMDPCSFCDMISDTEARQDCLENC